MPETKRRKLEQTEVSSHSGMISQWQSDPSTVVSGVTGATGSMGSMPLIFPLVNKLVGINIDVGVTTPLAQTSEPTRTAKKVEVDFSTHLESAPERGDSLVIKGTRIEASQIWWLSRKCGQSDKEIVDSFGDITMEQVAAAIRWVDGEPELQRAGDSEEDRDA